MKLIWWMLAGSFLSSLVLSPLFGAEAGLEIWLGMLGPLASAIASWIAMERQHLRRPEGMTRLMIKAFAAKMIFFAAYIAVLLRSGWVRPTPFVVSFIGYFLSLHAMEAFGLRRLQAAALPDSPADLRGS